jgi:signal transduction histidine kinase
MISYICATINYNSYIKNFLNNKIILEKNIELNSMYNTAQDALIEKTNALIKAEQYEKLRTNFFANISHELRTPLTIIFSGQQMLDIILRRTDLGVIKSDIYKYMGIINQNCNRLLRIISNLIDITKIDAGYFNVYLGKYDIVKVVEDITLSVARYIEDRDIKLTFDTEIEEKVIACDPEKIERIMLNLLSNSVKFTPAGGSIYVNICLKLNNVVITVKDTGIGIPPMMRNLIFERFIQVDKTTTRNNEGSGIGLCIVKSLVELHNGRIFVISEEGAGSEFVIELPDKTVESKGQSTSKIAADENSRIHKINIEFSDIYN